MPGTLGHLTRRFFDYLTTSALGQVEIEAVRSYLSTEEQQLFFAQNSKDQAHGYNAASVVIADGRFGQSAIQAALLHDIGKRHASLGLFGRVFVSIAIKLKVPLSRRMRAYRDHGPIAADELADIGSDPIVVSFAGSHHGSRPALIDEDMWDLLQEADEPPKTVVGRGRR